MILSGYYGKKILVHLHETEKYRKKPFEYPVRIIIMIIIIIIMITIIVMISLSVSTFSMLVKI